MEEKKHHESLTNDKNNHKDHIPDQASFAMSVEVKGDQKIGQYDGNDDSDIESEVEQSPLENI